MYVEELQIDEIITLFDGGYVSEVVADEYAEACAEIFD